MTRRQVIAKMKSAGIEGKVTGAGKLWEVELADEATMVQFCTTIEALGGYKTGYDSWILRPGYVPMGDWNDKSSKWHY